LADLAEWCVFGQRLVLAFDGKAFVFQKIGDSLM
jgi:hypothetical protein